MKRNLLVMLLTCTAGHAMAASVNSPTPLPFENEGFRSDDSDPGEAAAQDGSAPAAVQEDSRGRLDEIVVTAQRRSENLQNVPIAITAITADEALGRGITSTQDLTTAVPGLNIGRSIGAAIVYVRGVGQTSAQAGQEQSVPIYVDGVYFAGVNTGNFSFNNIERLEVLKGPQGTLFGRNAVGGAINIVTLDPSFDPSMRASISYGNYGMVSSQGYLTFGMTDSAAVGIAAYANYQGDAFGANLVSGNGVYRTRDNGVRGKLLFQPSANTKIVVAGDYAWVRSSQGIAKRALEGGNPLLGGSGFPGFYNVRSDIDQYSQTEQYGGNVKFEQGLGSVKFVSISALRKSRTTQLLDVDTGPTKTAQGFFNPDRLRTFTQELQLQSDGASAVEWIVGGFYLNSRASLDPLEFSGSAFPAGQNLFVSQLTKSYAVFAQGSAKIWSGGKLTLGARYNWDSRDISGYATNAADVRLATYAGERSWSQPTWRIVLDQKVAPDVMVYGSYNRGYKAGVYNLTAPSAAAVNPEQLDAFEVGVKSQLDRRFRVNMSAFYYDYKNIQLTKQLGATTALVNAASAEMYGVEAQLTAIVSSRLKLGLNGEYVHARYKSFPGAPSFTPRAGGGNLTVVGGVDASGRHMIRTPDFSFNANIDYAVPTGFGEVTFNANFFHSSSVYYEPDNRLRQAPFNTVNTQVALDFEDGKYGLRAFVKNAFNERYADNLISSAFGDTGSPAPPRTYGVGLNLRF